MFTHFLVLIINFAAKRAARSFSEPFRRLLTDPAKEASCEENREIRRSFFANYQSIAEPANSQSSALGSRASNAAGRRSRNAQGGGRISDRSPPPQGQHEMSHNLFNTLQEFKVASGKIGKFYSLPALERALGARISRLPVSIRIVLESVLRNCDAKKITEEHVRQLAGWKPNAPRTDEIPFVLSRILLQDLTGIPSLADLAAMRSVAQRLGKDPKVVEPLVPVDLVVDHSIQIDHTGSRTRS